MQDEEILINIVSVPAWVKLRKPGCSLHSSVGQRFLMLRLLRPIQVQTQHHRATVRPLCPWLLPLPQLPAV